MRERLASYKDDKQVDLTKEEKAAQHGHSKVPPWQCPSSAPVPAQGTPGGSGQLSTPRARPSHWAPSPWVPSHRLGCSSEPPPAPPISPRLPIQAALFLEDFNQVS